MPRLYNKYRKNPQYIILIFTNPIVKIPSPKKDSVSCLFYFMQVFVEQMPARRELLIDIAIIICPLMGKIAKQTIIAMSSQVKNTPRGIE